MTKQEDARPRSATPTMDSPRLHRNDKSPRSRSRTPTMDSPVRGLNRFLICLNYILQEFICSKTSFLISYLLCLVPDSPN